MRRVLIGTPSHDGKLEAYYVHALTQTIRLCWGKIEIRELILCYEALIQNLRNDIVADALHFKFDDLIFIDADQDWQAEWVPTLLSYPVDCVGAAVRKKTDEAELYNVRLGGGVESIQVDAATGLWTAPDIALGCGFLRFSRKALQVLWDNSEKYTSAPGKRPAAWIFDVRPIEGQLVGEDIHASLKLRSLGIPTWLDPNMTCGHIGAKKFTGDFQAYIRRQQKLVRPLPLPSQNSVPAHDYGHAHTTF